MEILTTVLLIASSVTSSIFLVYKGVMGVRKTFRAEKK